MSVSARRWSNTIIHACGNIGVISLWHQILTYISKRSIFIPFQLKYELNPSWCNMHNHYEGRFTPWTMKSDHARWPYFMVRYLKDQYTKSLGPSLGVNRLWTKMNDHAPKSECADFFNICRKRAILKKRSQVWPFSCLLLTSLVFTSC